MTTSYLPYHPDQAHLLPVSAADWLPEGHLAYFIADTVESLDLSAFHARYAKGGPRNQPFHPAMMVKVLLYGYATGVFSSRKLAKRLHDDVAFRVLAAGNFPAHRTLSDFRALHLQELSALFVQVVKLARECGLAKLGTIAVDGVEQHVSGRGKGLVSSVLATMHEAYGLDFEVLDYSEHALGQGADAQAAAYIEWALPDGRKGWGVGIDEDVATASVRAILSAANGAVLGAPL